MLDIVLVTIEARNHPARIYHFIVVRTHFEWRSKIDPAKCNWACRAILSKALIMISLLNGTRDNHELKKIKNSYCPKKNY